MRLTTALLAVLLCSSLVLAQAADYKTLSAEASALEKNKDHAAAAAKFLEAAQVAPGGKEKGQSLTNAVRNQRRVKGSEAQALDLYKQITQTEGATDAHYSAAMVSFGTLLYELKRYDESTAALTASLGDARVNKADKEIAQQYLGNNQLYGARNFEAAREAYGKLLAEDVSLMGRYNGQMGVAATYDRERRYEDSLREYRKAVEIAADPKLEPYRARALVETGNTLRRLKQPAEARAAYEQAQAIPKLAESTMINIRMRIGQTYVDEGNAAQAKPLLEEVIANPASPESYKKEAQATLDKLK